MTHLFDQYEQASHSRFPGSAPPTAVRPEMSTTGFIHMKLSEEIPIFGRMRINYDPPNPLTHLAVSSNFLVLALANKTIRRFDCVSPDAAEDIDLTMQTKIINIFLDPLGCHLLISVNQRVGDNVQPELLYLPKKLSKPKNANKCKGIVVTSVGWSYNNKSENTTGPILLGTSKGLIIETEIGAEDKFFHSGLEQYWKQVFDIGKGSDMPITGLQYCCMPRSDRCFILATTTTRLYQFVDHIPSAEERPMLQHIFNSYLNVPERFLDIPSECNYSQLEFFRTDLNSCPKTFAWLTGPGILYGQIDPFNQASHDSVTVDTELLQYPLNGEGTNETNLLPPKAIALTEYHVLLLYKDRIKGVCTMNEQLVFEDIHSQLHGNLLGITRDPVNKTLWAFSEHAVFRYKVVKEARNMWQVYIEKGDFEKAKQCCKDDPAHSNAVSVKQAEYLFEKKDYNQSALHYALTQSSFEETALKFLQANQHDALKTFLIKKLSMLKPQEKTQSTMIVVWVVELYLNQLGEMRDKGLKDTKEYREQEADFVQFITQSKIMECVGNIHNTVYKLLASHGDKDNFIHCTKMLKDYDRVIQSHIQNKDYLAALEVLKSHGTPDMFYKFSLTLIQVLPKQTVEVLMNEGSRLQAAKFVPLFVLCDYCQNATLGKEVLTYLESCVYSQGNKDLAVHNYLLSLYATLEPEKLMIYLEYQGVDQSSISYNPHYALRLCLDRGLDKACVHLYTTLELYDKAVDLALQFDVELAKHTAAIPENDDELRKKLWLKIARHVVKEKNDIGQAMKFLQSSDLVKIEDVLPFFPDFVTIDHFKDAICTSLQEYNQHIQDLKEEMDVATKSAEVIREEIKEVKNRFTVVSSGDTCSSCNTPILSRSFHLFPCGHQFHTDCLVEEVKPHLSDVRLERLTDLQHQLSVSSSKDQHSSISSGKDDLVSLGPAVTSRIEQLYDDIVAAECIFCGENMIRLIDKPFISETDYDRIMKEWE